MGGRIMITRVWRQVFAFGWVMLAVIGSGCMATRSNTIASVDNMPKELNMSTLSEHIIEPPDVLQIDLIAAVPKPPYKLQPLDAILLRVPEGNTLPDAPIRGNYQIDTDGTINIGAAYGAPVSVIGKTIPEAKAAIAAQIAKFLKIEPTIEIALAQSRGMQQVRGQHLVRPDGSVWFDIYGAVRLVGMTIPEAKQAIEAHLSQFFLKPEVAISITGYNSKVFYIIFDSPYNGGSQLVRLPVTGNEKVIDALSQVGGVPQTSDFRRMWIARPAPEGSAPQILPIDWRAITEKADVATNYQVLPGDRIFVKTHPLNTLSASLDRLLAPSERLLGYSLLLVGAYQNFRSINQGGLGFGNNGLGGLGF
jgi:polysaccharide biosynthesis/export protein